MDLEGNLNKVGKGGGPVATLATETGGTLRGLTVAGNHVFYVSGSVVNQLYQVGNAKAAVTPGLAAPSAVALSGSYLYFTAAGTTGASFSDGALGRVPVELSSAPPKLVGPVEPLADAQNHPSALALDATHVFWLTGEGHVHRAKLDGSDGTVLAQGTEDPDRTPQGIALDSTHVYWTSWGACPNAAGCGDKQLHGRVQRVAKTGGPKQILAEGKFLPTGIGVDASAVYWTNWWFTSVSRLAL